MHPGSNLTITARVGFSLIRKPIIRTWDSYKRMNSKKEGEKSILCYFILFGFVFLLFCFIDANIVFVFFYPFSTFFSFFLLFPTFCFSPWKNKMKKSKEKKPVEDMAIETNTFQDSFDAWKKFDSPGFLLDLSQVNAETASSPLLSQFYNLRFSIDLFFNSFVLLSSCSFYFSLSFVDCFFFFCFPFFLSS